MRGKGSVHFDCWEKGTGRTGEGTEEIYYGQ